MKHVVAATLALALAFSPSSHGQLGGKAPKSKAKADARVKQALDEAGQKYEVDADGDFKLVMETGTDGRTQVVFVNSATESYSGFEIREVWSVGLRTPTSFSAAVANELLKDNYRKKLGAWQVQRINNQDSAVFCAKVSAALSSSELVSVLTAVVKSADAMENSQTDGKDVY